MAKTLVFSNGPASQCVRIDPKTGKRTVLEDMEERVYRVTEEVSGRVVGLVETTSMGEAMKLAAEKWPDAPVSVVLRGAVAGRRRREVASGSPTQWGGVAAQGKGTRVGSKGHTEAVLREAGLK